MLVLTRKTSESIVIDGRITITIVHLKGNAVRIGIDAPDDVSIYRAELLKSKDWNVAKPSLPAPVELPAAALGGDSYLPATL